MGLLIEHADQKEQRARAQPVVDPLQDGPLDTGGVERKDAQRHKAQMADGRVGHELLHVLLGEGDDRAVDDADDGQHGDERRVLVCRLGEEGQVEADQTIGAHLQQHAGQDDGAGRRRFGVGVGQPGVEGKDRHLDGEGQEETQEEQVLCPGKGRPPGNQVGQGERAVGDAHVEDGQQHQQRGGHRVQEELDRGVDPPRSAPDADQEVHRHQGELPEDVEQEQVLGQEHAHHARLQQQAEDVELLHLRLDGVPRRGDGQHGDERGQQHHEDAQPVDGQEVLDAPRGDPVEAVDHLQAGHGGVIAHQDQQRPQEGDDRRADGYAPNQVHRAALGRVGQQNRQHADQGQEGDYCKYPVHCFLCVLCSLCALA